MHMVQTPYAGLFHITGLAIKPRTNNKGDKALFIMAGLGHSKCKDSYGFLWGWEPTTVAAFPCPVLETSWIPLKGFCNEPQNARVTAHLKPVEIAKQNKKLPGFF